MGFSRQVYWSELPFPSPGDLPDPEIEPGSPALQTDSVLSEPSDGGPKVQDRGRVTGAKSGVCLTQSNVSSVLIHPTLIFLSYESVSPLPIGPGKRPILQSRTPTLRGEDSSPRLAPAGLYS